MAPNGDMTSEEELAQLRERIRELEEEVSRRREATESPSSKEDISDLIKETSSRIADKANNLNRAFVIATLEQIRLTSEVTSSFVDELIDKTTRGTEEKGERRRVFKDLTAVPGDLYYAFLTVIEKSLDIPSKTAEKFRETYTESRKN